MPDTFPTLVEFGGALRRADLDELLTLLEGSGAYLDWMEGESDFAAALDAAAASGQSVSITDHGAYYDTFDELCTWLTAHDLAWRWQQDSKYEYDAELRVWFPGMDKPVGSLGTNDGEPTIVVATLRAAAEKGQTLEQILAPYAVFEREIPPLTLED